MEGVYSTRSATTNPTGKKRLEAGKNVMAAQQTPMKVAGERARVQRTARRRRSTITARPAKKEKVMKFRGSARDLTRGTVSWPQSHSSGCGTRSMKALMGTR
jgi:hypothetical protein